MKKTLIGYSGSQTAVTCLALGVVLHFTALPGLSKGKPGGGGTDPPPSTPAPVEYQLTWIPGINDGRMDIFDCNTAGFAVGGYTDETGTYAPFCTTADGLIRPLKDWWALPTGWRLLGTEMQINETNLVCGTIRNEQTSENQLFLASLSDPHSLEVVGPVQKYSSLWVFMNENGDVTWRSNVEGNITTLHLYVRSLDKSFSLDTGERSYWPTGINDHLQISLVRWDRTGDYYMSPMFSGSGLLTFDVATEIAYIEPLGDYSYSWADPLLLPWGGLNNAGDVFGCFETKVSRVRYSGGRVVSRVADTTAGFIAADSATWSELDPRLPVGGAQANAISFAAATCALDVNESGQVVGGYQQGKRGTWHNLWTHTGDSMGKYPGLTDLECAGTLQTNRENRDRSVIWRSISCK
ncbi:MAG: hypothetical protein R3F19_01350 [Verrucomicrobiales bacterium]